jgi:hypothetical protein
MDRVGNVPARCGACLSTTGHCGPVAGRFRRAWVSGMERLAGLASGCILGLRRWLFERSLHFLAKLTDRQRSLVNRRWAFMIRTQALFLLVHVFLYRADVGRAGGPSPRTGAPALSSG